MAQTKQLTVDAEKAAYIEKISKLSIESLKILAEKSEKPGIEGKLKTYAAFI